MAANLSIAPGIAYDGFPALVYGPSILTPSQSNFEDGSTGGWLGYGGSATLTNVTSQAYVGTHSLQMASTAAGDSDIIAPSSIFLPTSSNLINSYVGGYAIRANTVGRNSYMAIQWQDRTGTVIGGQSPITPGVTDLTTGWTFTAGNLNNPIGAVSALPLIIINSTAAAGEIHWVDAIFFGPGIFYPP